MHITVKADATDQNDSNAVKKTGKRLKSCQKMKKKSVAPQNAPQNAPRQIKTIRLEKMSTHKSVDLGS